MKKLILINLIMFVIISACKTIPSEVISTSTAETTTNNEPVGSTPIPQTEQPITKDQKYLLPEPVRVTFAAEDNQELNGTFFPAARQTAPVIVLMHWYPGDQYEWTEIAYWLQNRGMHGDTDGVPWKDPNWFPELNSEDSYNVLTFTFRGCSGRCNTFQQNYWLLDAKAALIFARTLPGVDPDQVISIGASIGADGAIDGCAAVLKDDPSACLGALSFSPGNYLNKQSLDMVTALATNDPPRPAWCFFDINDPDSAMCNDIKSDNYHPEGWSGGNLHGMHLITQNLDPKPLERMLNFLALVTEN